jgi:hypothetical protein
VSDEAIDALIERIDDLEHLDDIRELTALC